MVLKVIRVIRGLKEELLIVGRAGMIVAIPNFFILTEVQYAYLKYPLVMEALEMEGHQEAQRQSLVLELHLHITLQ